MSSKELSGGLSSVDLKISNCTPPMLKITASEDIPTLLDIFPCSY
jgi:hypothetical protein